MSHPLDNPAWQALSSQQQTFGVLRGAAARYHPSISPIAALGAATRSAYGELAELTPSGDVVAVFANGVEPGPSWQSLAAIELTQWVCDEPNIDGLDVAAEMVDLEAESARQMYDLAKAADPGPFEMDTYQLGDYVGIFDGDRLVAMAGERICLPGYREVSAVSTLSGYEGRGYARALVAEIVRRQVRAGTVPFLHVRTGSPAEAAAKRVYAKLGFTLRGDFVMNVLRRV